MLRPGDAFCVQSPALQIGRQPIFLVRVQSEAAPGKDLFPAAAEIRARIESMARFYGALGGVTYAEPFLQKEVGLVEDLTMIPVKSI